MASKSFRVLLVDNNPADVHEIRKHIKEIEASWGIELTHIEDPTDVLEELSNNPYDILMTEYKFNDLTGFDLFEEINDISWDKPIIMVTNDGSETTAAKALRYDATDYRIKRNLDPTTLKQSIQMALKKYLESSREKQEQAKLKQEAGEDDVTGLDNRRLLREKIQDSIDSSKNNNEHLSIFMLALKNFDQINAIHGQETGDDILKQLGSFIGSNVRDGDYAGRYQGVEFCIAMPQTDQNKAGMLAKRFLNELKGELNGIEEEYNVSVAYGGTVIERKAGENEVDDLMKRAVEKLYQAKVDVNENELVVE